jgi:tape measure domain-containing protein
MAGLTVRIKADASQFSKTVKDVKGQLNGLTGAVAGIGAAIGAVWASVKSVQAIGDALQDSSKKAAGMEMLEMQFETLTKSTATAKKLIQDFRTEAQKSPLTTQDYAQAAQKMLTVGKSADEVMPTLKMLGDVSMGNGLKFERLSLAYSQVIAKGRLMGQENNQLAESGFNPLAQISKKTGESMKELMKRMEDGGITAGEVTEAFKDATSAGGLFFQAIQKGAETMDGKLAMTRDSIDNLQIAFGTGMNEGIKVGLDAINSGLPLLQEKFTEAGKMFGIAISDAVHGDTERLQAIGVFIGTVIAEAAKVTAKGLLSGVGAKTFSAMDAAENTLRDFTGLSSVIGKSNLGERASAANDVMMKENIRQAINEAGFAASNLRTAVNGPSYTPMTSEQYDAAAQEQFSKKMDRLNANLEAIKDNTSKQKFPN